MSEPIRVSQSLALEIQATEAGSPVTLDLEHLDETTVALKYERSHIPIIRLHFRSMHLDATMSMQRQRHVCL
jgi:hypothetical protein